MMYIPVKCPFNICQSAFTPCNECFYKIVPVVDVLLGNFKGYPSPIDKHSDVVNILPNIFEF